LLRLPTCATAFLMVTLEKYRGRITTRGRRIDCRASPCRCRCRCLSLRPTPTTMQSYNRSSCYNPRRKTVLEQEVEASRTILLSVSQHLSRLLTSSPKLLRCRHAAHGAVRAVPTVPAVHTAAATIKTVNTTHRKRRHASQKKTLAGCHVCAIQTPFTL
jgi:hypothetical protein